MTAFGAIVRRQRLHVTIWVTVIAAVAAGCDDDQQRNHLDASSVGPADRIIALAPHLTELVFTAGAGDRLVGIVEYSDFPDAARTLPSVGDAFRLDYEAIAALEPDLVLSWKSGTPSNVMFRLQDMGYRVIELDSGRLDKIAANLRAIGQLAGTPDEGNAAAMAYEDALRDLRSRYRDAKEISVFYQISMRPMLTISRHHLIGEAIEICGGLNIFGSLDELTPAISVEAVMDRSPEVIMVSNYSADGSERSEDLSQWARWPHIPAVENGNLYFVNADQITRPSTRMLGGVEAICQNLDAARGKASATAGREGVRNPVTDPDSTAAQAGPHRD